MKKLISAATSLAMIASLAASVVPTAVLAADAKKSLTIASYAQSGSKYANQGSSIKISEADIAAGDVKIPCAVYLSEDTNDTQTMSIPITINSDQADVKNVKFDLIDPSKPYFDSDQAPYNVKNAVVFASEYDDLDGYLPTGTTQLTCEPQQIAAGAKNYYIGFGELFPRGYSWTGDKSDDYPVFVFDVTFPKGTAAGDYTIDFCDYIKDDKGNPGLLLETDERYATSKGNLDLKPLTISVMGDSVPSTTSAVPDSTTTTTVTTTSHLANDYDIYFDFGNYAAKAGDKVTVDVKLQSENNCPVASIDAKFKLDSPLTISALGKKSEAYGSAAVESNLETNQLSFISLDGSEPIVGKNGESVFKAVVQIPEDCPDGIYKIGFDNCEIYKNGGSSDMWTWYGSNGLITVGDIGEVDPSLTGTSSATTTTVTTSSGGDVHKPADVVFDFGSVSGKPGDDVTVNVTLKEGNVGVASMDVQYLVPSPLKITSFGKKSEAYGSASIESNPDTNQQSFIALDQKGEPVVGTAGSSVFKFVVHIPEDCPAGDYQIGFKNCEIYKSGKDSAMWSWEAVNNVISVEGGASTSSSTSTTTTTSTTTSNIVEDPTLTSPVEFDFGSYEAKAGETVTVDVKLKKGDVGVASMDVKYKVDSPLTITSFGKKSEAYGAASVESNPDTNQQSFIALDQKGEPVVGTVGSSVFKFVVSVPENCPNGEYKVDFDNCEIYKSGKNSEMWGYSSIPATIKVTGGKEPEPSTSTEDGDIVFDFGTYEAKAGETVTVDVKLKSGSVGVASMDVKYKVDSPLKITSYGKKSEAYGAASVESNPETNQQSFIALDQKGEPVVGTAGSSVFKFVITIPENCAGGTYNIGFDNCEIYKSGKNSDMWKWSAVGGTIKVDGGSKNKYSGVGDLDKNGKVVAVDASLLLAYVADINLGAADVTDEDMYICDVDRNGKITSVDASIILTYYADLAAGFEGTFVDYLVEKIGVDRSSVED